jgi:hypothetical protein
MALGNEVQESGFDVTNITAFSPMSGPDCENFMVPNLATATPLL